MPAPALYEADYDGLDNPGPFTRKPSLSQTRYRSYLRRPARRLAPAPSMPQSILEEPRTLLPPPGPSHTLPLSQPADYASAATRPQQIPQHTQGHLWQRTHPHHQPLAGLKEKSDLPTLECRVAHAQMPSAMQKGKGEASTWLFRPSEEGFSRFKEGAEVGTSEEQLWRKLRAESEKAAMRQMQEREGLAEAEARSRSMDDSKRGMKVAPSLPHGEAVAVADGERRARLARSKKAWDGLAAMVDVPLDDQDVNESEWQVVDADGVERAKEEPDEGDWEMVE